MKSCPPSEARKPERGKLLEAGAGGWWLVAGEESPWGKEMLDARLLGARALTGPRGLSAPAL